jgi:predicted nucleotidyltransferase
MNSSLRVVMPEARRGFDEAAGYAVTEGETHPQREPPMHRLIEAKRPEFTALCRRFRVQRLDVFGSAARGDDFSESDLPWKVDVVDWATTGESFRRIITAEKVVVQKGPGAPRPGRALWARRKRRPRRGRHAPAGKRKCAPVAQRRRAKRTDVRAGV